MAASSYWLTAPKRFAQDRLVVFGLLVALLGLYLPGLGSYGLYDPWETHYGEVARTMVETGNYIDPWWGSPWDPTDVKREKEGFYSKPPLTMWMQATGMNLLGYNEWGVRLLFPLGAILALLAIYLAMARFFNRRAGLLAVAVTATAPFYAMLGRQAVTDGPMVAIMTIGMMSLAVGLFLCDEDEEASPTLYWGVTALLLLVACAQLWAMWPMDRSPDVVRPYPGEGFFRSIEWWFRETLAVAAGKGWALALFLAPVVFLAARREELESSHPDMAGGNAGEDCTWKQFIAINGFAGRHSGKRPCCGNAERMHRFTHDIFAQHRPQRRLAIAATRIGCPARALQLDVTPVAKAVDYLTDEKRPPVTQLRGKTAKLVAGIDLCQRVCTLRHRISGEDFGKAGLIIRQVQTKFCGKLGIEADKPGCWHLSCPPAGIETGQFFRIGIVKGKGLFHHILLPDGFV